MDSNYLLLREFLQLTSRICSRLLKEEIPCAQCRQNTWTDLSVKCVQACWILQLWYFCALCTIFSLMIKTERIIEKWLDVLQAASVPSKWGWRFGLAGSNSALFETMLKSKRVSKLWTTGKRFVVTPWEHSYPAKPNLLSHQSEMLPELYICSLVHITRVKSHLIFTEDASSFHHDTVFIDFSSAFNTVNPNEQ